MIDDDIFTDSETVIDESGWGGASDFDLAHLSRGERTAIVNRRRALREKWAKAHAVRESWTPEQHAEEEARLAAEIAEFLEMKNAA
ncbi:hypothetical protein [uncultured Roseovarius sp.]|uniref:hypothetical protein n=1 Tax=uncultured Roseovarius sp. TaxID=293344 RepID=UPI002596940B|nr:hypothetical protein [uncultured Roseovarius sp.]